MVLKRFSGYIQFQDLRRGVQSPKPKSDIWCPKCAYGGVTGLGLSPKKYQFVCPLPKVSSYSLIFADRHVAPLKVGCWQWGANLHSCIFTHFPFPINPLVLLQKWQCAGNFYHYNLNMAEDESICEGLSFPSTFSLCQPCFSWSQTRPLYHGETGKNIQALIQTLKL